VRTYKIYVEFRKVVSFSVNAGSHADALEMVRTANDDGDISDEWGGEPANINQSETCSEVVRVTTDCLIG